MVRVLVPIALLVASCRASPSVNESDAQAPPATAKEPPRVAMDSFGRPSQRAHTLSDTRSPAELAQAACEGADGRWHCKHVVRSRRVGAGTVAPVRPASWSVPAWYIDPANSSGTADDGDDCTTSTTACMTWGEVGARWGTAEPLLSSTVTITFLSSHSNGSDPVILRPYLLNGAYLHVWGATPTVVSSGTFQAFTAKNRSTPQLTSPTLATGQAAGAVNWLLYDSDHVGYAWVYKVVAGDQVVTSEPLTRSVWPANPTRVTTWTNGDHYQVLSLTKVNIVDIRPINVDYDGSVKNQVVLHQLSVFDPGGFGNDNVQLGSAWSMEYARVERAPTIGLNGLVLRNDLMNCNLQGGFDPGALLHMLGGILFAPYASTDFGGPPSTYEEFVFDPIFGTSAFDHILSTGFSVRFGGVYLDTGVTLNVLGTLALVNNLADSTAVLWGPGAVNIGNGRLIKNAGAQTWANTLLYTGGTTLAGQATASSYASGTWNAGIAVSGANLDAAAGPVGFGGTAIDPQSGTTITDRPISFF